MEEEIVYEGRYLNVLRRGPFEYTKTRRSRHVALTIPLTDGNEIVFLRQFRAPLNTHVIEYPAGLIGDEAGYEDETAESAAGRELIEESGYRAEKLEYLFEGPSSPGSSAELVTFFLATGCHKVSEGGGVGHEEITVHAVPLGQAADWLDEQAGRGDLVDPRTRLGVLLALQQKRGAAGEVDGTPA